MSSLSLSASYQSFFITLDKIKKTKLPCSWNVLTTECNKPACFYKMLDIPSYSQHQLKISHSVVVNLDLSWKIIVHGYEVTSEVCSTLFDGIPSVQGTGYKVISLTGDKGSCNTKFFRLHNKIAKSEVTYKVPNPYTSEKRDIYFISDVPHLIKTVRNCWSNSFCHNQARALWVRYHTNNIQCLVAIH